MVVAVFVAADFTFAVSNVAFDVCLSLVAVVSVVAAAPPQATPEVVVIVSLAFVASVGGGTSRCWGKSMFVVLHLLFTFFQTPSGAFSVATSTVAAITAAAVVIGQG